MTTSQCVNCREPVGGDTHQIPLRIPDERGGDEEVWCPQCFVWKRALLEPHRFHWHSLAAVKCGRCSAISVDFGRRACSQCFAPFLITLSAKPVVVQVG